MNPAENLTPAEIDGIVWALALAGAGWLFLRVGPTLSEDSMKTLGVVFLLFAGVAVLMGSN
jgi:hypothetical protein